MRFFFPHYFCPNHQPVMNQLPVGGSFEIFVSVVWPFYHLNYSWPFVFIHSLLNLEHAPQDSVMVILHFSTPPSNHHGTWVSLVTLEGAATGGSHVKHHCSPFGHISKPTCSDWNYLHLPCLFTTNSQPTTTSLKNPVGPNDAKDPGRSRSRK